MNIYIIIKIYYLLLNNNKYIYIEIKNTLLFCL